ncbi:4-(cytidine 5'-diphospho)-2-C-methyl-D-erythritol kinase [Candidatus Latescibacterota bacterium]
MTVIEKAPAKINLGLKILARRDDGYHDLLSIFQTVSLYDELHISLSNNPGFVCEHPDVPSDSDNLVMKAENLLKKTYNIPSAHYILKKRIPLGAGLGGGSADAAAALRGLNNIHSLKLSNDVLSYYAAQLGSDVPFMLNGGTSVVSGRGEHIAIVSWPFNFIYVVVYPKIVVSTSWAYKSLKTIGENVREYKKITDDLCSGRLDESEFILFLINDFEESVFKEYPLLKKIKSDIIASGAKTSFLTGSGSSIVGIFDKEDAAGNCADIFKDTDYTVFIAKAVSP